MEEWKDVIGYEGLYQVSSLGNVKSLSYAKTKQPRLLKPLFGSGGYVCVKLCKNRNKTTKRIHQIVAESFLNHTPCGFKLVINHKNFIKTDNRLENLEIVTTRENTNLKHIKSSSKYVGVSWNKRIEKWCAHIIVNGKKIHLGCYSIEIEAYNVYQEKLNNIIS